MAEDIFFIYLNILDNMYLISQHFGLHKDILNVTGNLGFPWKAYEAEINLFKKSVGCFKKWQSRPGVVVRGDTPLKLDQNSFLYQNLTTDNWITLTIVRWVNAVVNLTLLVAISGIFVL